MGMREFVAESNRIEGIHEVRHVEVAAHKELMQLEKLAVGDLEKFVHRITGPRHPAQLRREPGMDVMVGVHRPPRGGKAVEDRLAALLSGLGRVRIDVEAEVLRRTLKEIYDNHCAFETLHPFMDGNGRAGRAVLLWQLGGKIPGLTFLHWWYYRSLDAWSGRQGSAGK